MKKETTFKGWRKTFQMKRMKSARFKYEEFKILANRKYSKIITWEICFKEFALRKINWQFI